MSILPVGFGILALAELLAHPGWAQTGALGAPAAITAQDIRGGGGWKTDGKGPAPTQRWGSQITRGPDNSLTGRVTLNGSPLANAGNVHGQIVGTNASGTLTDDAGQQIATFVGTVTQSGLSGTYTDRTGETGSWSWDGPPPQ